MARARRPATLHSVFERTMREHGRALVGWVGGLVALAVVMLALYPTVRGNEEFAKLIQSYPETFRTLFGIADYTSGPGYVRAEIFSLMGPMLLVIMAILWGSDLTAGEEERGTIDVLLANPISRRRVVVEKWLALVVGVALATASLGVVLAVGGPVVKMEVGGGLLWAAVVATGLMALLFGTVALAIGAASGHRGLARGVSAMVAVASYLLSSLPALVSWLTPGRPVSPWYQALGVDPLATGFRPVHLVVLVAVTAVFLVGALAAFERRDLAV